MRIPVSIFCVGLLTLVFYLLPHWAQAQSCVADAGPDITICAGDSVQLGTAQIPGLGYIWTNDVNSDSLLDAQPFVSPTSTTTYYLFVDGSDPTCPAFDTVSVTVNAIPSIPPIGNISSNSLQSAPFTNCVGGNFVLNLVNSSVFPPATPITAVGNIDSFRVDWGDGSPIFVGTSIPFPNSHTYTQQGVFTLVITAISDQGCTRSETYTVANQTNPGVGIGSPGGTQRCAPADLGFVLNSYQSNTPGTIYIWDFGDSSSQVIWDYTYPLTISDTISHPYLGTSCSQPGGQFIVTVSALNFCDTTSAAVNNIRIYETPQADFEVSEPVGCVDTTEFCFTNTTITGFDGSCTDLTSYLWDFGDGTSQTGSNNILFPNDSINACHTYDQPGTYTITLAAWNNVPECDTSFHSETIRVNAPPVSIIDATDSTGCVPLTVTFDGSNSTGGELSYQWLVDPPVGWNYVNGFGADSVITRITFSDPGAYTVSLVTSNNCGRDTADFLVIVGGDVSLSLNPLPNGCDSITQFPTVVLDTAFGFLTNISWSFVGGSPDTSEVVDPGAIFYGTPGTYTISVSTQTSCGTASDSETFNVFESPTANFEAAPVCDGDSTRFTNLSVLGTGPGNNTLAIWQWDFGDGTVFPNDTTPNPVHLYDTCGIYTVTLTIIDNNGCTHDTSLTVEVYCLPQVNFTSDEVCEGGPTSFTDLSINGTGTIATWNWQFAAGQTDSIPNPQFQFDSCGIFNVRLNVVDDLGCQNSIQLPARVLCRPEANFSAPAVCQGIPMSFTDTSIPGDSTLASWEWLFGDGNAGLGTPISHLYDTCGVYSAQLIVTDANNCKDTVNRNTVVHCLPDPGFEATTVCLGSPTTFTDTSSAGSGTLNSWTWDFGDGSAPVVQTSLAPVNYTYPTCGFFVVTLTVGNTNGCVQIVSDSVFVRCLPEANFSAPSVCEGFTTSFSDLSVNGTGTINSWSWDFGGGLTSSAQDTALIFSTCGDKVVTLIVQDDLGCADDTTQLIRISCPPNANFAVAPVCEGIASTFADLSIPGDTAIASWDWLFGDGQASTLPMPTNLYAACDTYNVRLIVSDVNGCQDTTTGDAIVLCPPSADFQADTVCEGVATSFTNLSIPASVYRWYFGDGDSSIQVTNTNVSHIYNSCGFYTATLIAGDGNNCQDTFTQTVFVRCLPIVAFQAPSVCVGNVVNFIDQSSSSNGVITTWSWDFGDTNTSSNQNPTYVYASDSSYFVSLTVTDTEGCSNTGIDSVQIFPLPTVDVIDTTVVICGQSILDTLSNYIISTSDPGVWSGPVVIGNTWQTQTDSATGAFNPALLVVGSSYTFYYTSTNIFGCQALDSVTISIVDAQIANAGPDTTLCFDAGTYDLNVGANPGGGIWSSPNGVVSSNGIFDVTASGAGIFTILYTTGAGTCQVIDTLIITVNPPLIADVGSDSVLFCFGGDIQLNGTASGGDGSYTYAWTPNIGLNDPTSANPTVAGINTTRLYILTVTDGLECMAIDSVWVKENPAILLDAGQPDSLCYGDMTQLVATASGGTAPFSFIWSQTNNLATPTDSLTGTLPLIASERFTVQLTDAEGCLAIDSVDVWVNEAIAITLNADTFLCHDDSTQITSTVNGGSGLYQYQWSPSNLLVDATVANPLTFGLTSTTTFILTVTDSAGCTQVDSITINVNPQLTAEIDLVGPACVGDTLTLQGSFGGGTPAYSFQWSPTVGLVSPNDTITQVLGLTTNTAYFFTVTDSRGCVAVDSFFVQLNTPLTLNVMGDTTICYGDSIVLGSTPGGGQGSYTFSWSPASELVDNTVEDPQTRALFADQTFYVELNDGAGCNAFDTLTVFVNDELLADAGADQTFCFGGNATLGSVNPGSGGSMPYVYAWTPNTGLNDSTLANPTVAGINTTRFYVLTVTDSLGCPAIDSVLVKENPAILLDAGQP
ncbi:MAG: PKD domain-containing protein, partial [Bacteroidota bacterium]